MIEGDSMKDTTDCLFIRNGIIIPVYLYVIMCKSESCPDITAKHSA